MADRSDLVHVDHVSQTYTSGTRQFTAIQDVNLTLAEGEFVSLLGPSGCGKSTLLRMITGLQRPTQGRVLYRGRVLTGVNPRATIVFQSFALFPWLTVEENVEVALKARGMSAQLRPARALDLLDRVGLDGFENAYPRELSGGMRQKVGFARAMAVEPELLCMDEPFSALDVLSAEALRGELLELWTAGEIPTKAILMVTHDIEEAVSMGDRIVVMEKDPGRVISEVQVKLAHPRHRKSPEFQTLVDQVYGLLAGQTKTEPEELGSAPGEPGHTRGLPHVPVGELAGFLEHLSQLPGQQADIYRLAEALGVDSDRVLRLTEAAELLNFCALAHGDIALTPLGETFAEAGIQARKEIFATRARRVPMVAWLLSLLAAADRHELERDVVESALRLEFPLDEAVRQVETLIDWGRYAELLAYDHGAGMIYADTANVPAVRASASG
jgi:NitT/TauT family transport system ATP-binding protein